VFGANVVDMSYSYTVKSSNGTLEVLPNGHVPDGEWQVSGHEDATRVDVTVTAKGADGKPLVMASGSSLRST
jgi:VCBS repeat-containing protein